MIDKNQVVAVRSKSTGGRIIGTDVNREPHIYESLYPEGYVSALITEGKMQDAMLVNATRRIVELESLLLVPVEQTVWPTEIALVFSQLNDASNLPECHQERLRHHINRMWLESVPMPKIITVASSLAKTLEQYA